MALVYKLHIMVFGGLAFLFMMSAAISASYACSYCRLNEYVGMDGTALSSLVCVITLGVVALAWEE